ncbi:RNA12 protein-domain-containing protein [Multifurca ochricompacta]|uniref:Mitochondrial escape protein 2 n=1 Tax=Multifurca ochricompacta TaxID=376703 RepID=A0AAD4MCT5_9AGAM|nr:RNA12 protein-domain-containing protein [Multifurca ochricompacta]
MEGFGENSIETSREMERVRRKALGQRGDEPLGDPWTSSSIHSTSQEQKSHAWLFIDSVFPVKLAIWDIRFYYGKIRQEYLIDSLRDIISAVQTHGFKPISIEPHVKDGGVFVLFEYIPSQSEDVLPIIQSDLRNYVRSRGGVPSSAGIRRGDIWVVHGQPWREDMNRFASPLLRVVFDGADPHEESLYHTFRPFGRIIDITAPAPFSGTSYRASTVTFSDLRSSIVARNVVYGIRVGQTRLRTLFVPPVQGHVIRDWITKHPRFVIPVVVFFLGTLTYTIFDPLRALMVEGKILDWFDYREFRLYQWLRRNTVGRLTLRSTDTADADTEAVWQGRQDAEITLHNYLDDMPTNVAFVYGPQGSGKSKMLSRILQDKKRPATGYWPVFTFLNSMSNLVDLASVGVIGQKAGLSSSLPDQVKQILEIVGTALRSVSSARRKQAHHSHENAVRAEEQLRDTKRVLGLIRCGVWHDPRMGPVAGGGVIAELGMGDEPFGERDEDCVIYPNEVITPILSAPIREGSNTPVLQGVTALPIVVLKNYVTNSKEDIMGVFAKWAAALVEGQTAHVVVVSHNRENSKSLAKALPSKPLNMIALFDADNASALEFIKTTLHEAGVEVQFSYEETEMINCLGGRASDLASFIHKMRAGQTPMDAVDDIIRQGVSELRKQVFGDDIDDARSLPWSREHAWAVLRALASKDTVPYYETLMNAPFKGDEGPLRSMEQVEMITVDTQNGRPSSIRPGRPIYRYVFKRLVGDPIFRATQDLASNAKLIESAEATVRGCERELEVLRTIGYDSVHWWSRPTAIGMRAKYLMGKMEDAQATLEKLERRNGELKKVLSECESHSTASILSLQGSTPLPGHPKTLRDLTNASTLLTLPSSFGAIQLGETFSGALAVNNESAATVDSVSLRIEIQTTTSKVLLADIGGPTLSLIAGDTLEATSTMRSKSSDSTSWPALSRTNFPLAHEGPQRWRR